MVSLEIRTGQLARLIEALVDLLIVLRLDQQCPFPAQFEEFVSEGNKIADGRFTQEELDNFSRAICRFFDPHAEGFFHYQLPQGLPAEGLHSTANFETFKRAVYARALELRSI